MKRITLLTSLAVLATAALGSLLAVMPARSQVQATPSLLPIGTSSSGNTSTVWFHEPSARIVVACQTVMQGSAPSSVQCVRGSLPN